MRAQQAALSPAIRYVMLTACAAFRPPTVPLPRVQACSLCLPPVPSPCYHAIPYPSFLSAPPRRLPALLVHNAILQRHAVASPRSQFPPMPDIEKMERDTKVVLSQESFSLLLSPEMALPEMRDDGCLPSPLTDIIPPQRHVLSPPAWQRPGYSR